MFKRDMQVGKRGETILKNLLEKANISTKTVDREARERYDMVAVLPSQQVTIEVKYDQKSRWTGNIAIEYNNCQRNKPSGINVTTADLYCYVVPEPHGNDVYLINTSLLKVFLNVTTPKKLVQGAGDGNADIYLYEKSVLLKEFTKVDESNIVEVIEKLVKS